MKVDRSGGSIDWSLGWFHGTDRTRDFVRAPLPPGGRPGTFTGVQQPFAQLDVFAADIADPIDRAIASQSAAVNNQLDHTQHGVTARIARKWLQDTLEFELATIAYFQTGDAAIRPKLSYAINDRLRFTAAADIFVGPRFSYFGRARGLSAAFLQLSYGF